MDASPSLALVLALAGCAAPPGPAPEAGGPPPAVYVEGDTTAPGRVRAEQLCGASSGRSSAPDVFYGEACPAEVSDYPAVYFGDTLLIRLPKGVDEDSLVEIQPNLACTSAPLPSVSCVGGQPPAPINLMALMWFEHDPDASLSELRELVFDRVGYEDVTITNEELDHLPGSYRGVANVPASGRHPQPAKALIQLTTTYGRVYAHVYETSPAAWNALAASFYSSAQRTSFLRL